MTEKEMETRITMRIKKWICLTFSKYRYKIFNKKGLEISLARGKNRKRLMVLVTFSVHLEEVLANPDVMPENVIINIIKTTFFNGRTDTYDVLK